MFENIGLNDDINKTLLLGICITNGLSGLMRVAVEKQLFQEIFGEAYFSNVLTIKSMLGDFELISGLRVNFYKSALGGVGLEGNTLDVYANIFNCRLIALPFGPCKNRFRKKIKSN